MQPLQRLLVADMELPEGENGRIESHEAWEAYMERIRNPEKYGYRKLKNVTMARSYCTLHEDPTENLEPGLADNGASMTMAGFPFNTQPRS